MARRLAGKIAIVTGSDSGMGQAMAEEFAKEGADVAVNYLEDQNGAKETKRRVEAQGCRAIVVCEEENVARLFEETGARHALSSSMMPASTRQGRTSLI